MARPTTFTKEMIVAAATELVAAEGVAALTTRTVASRLASSTAPIYSTFASIDELRDAVIDRAREQLRRATRQPWTDRPFLNEGTGLVVFARDNPRLFALLFLTPDVATTAIPKVYADLLADMKKDGRFASFTARERDIVLEKLWFVAVGMATLAHAGRLRDATTHGIVTALLEAGGVLIPDAVERVGRARRS
ncbi:MAG: TetR family transcriptional regulator [Deltaproteobacteria bacterium]|nr:TetR family transcriptional regulator [Deltaproteobacteria bacterium]